MLENTKTFNNFTKKHDYIVCIDSDGTVMDSMNIKHQRCFGPCFVEVVGLDKYKEEALNDWNLINLHGKTRARNRFITFGLMLHKYNYILNFDLTAYDNWVNNTTHFTNDSILKEFDKTHDNVFKLASYWNMRVNEEIDKLTLEDKKPFEGVKEFFEFAKGKVDLAVVSSANLTTLLDEWGHFDLYKYVDLFTSQNDGSKEACIKKVISLGYDPKHVIMMGDAIVDLETSINAGSLFYPISPLKEKESWELFKNKYFEYFTSDRFLEVSDSLIEEFMKA